MLSSRLLRPAATFAVKRSVLTARLPTSTTTSFRFMSGLTAPTSSHHHTPLDNAQGSIIYTETDEAPALATYSLLPVIAKVSIIIHQSFPSLFLSCRCHRRCRCRKCRIITARRIFQGRTLLTHFLYSLLFLLLVWRQGWH